MKKLFLLLLGTLLFSWSCQKRHYIQHIPAPDYEHVERSAIRSLNQEDSTIETQNEILAQPNPDFLIASSNNDPATISISHKELYTSPKSNALITAPVSAKKLTFKEKMIRKVVARKVQKATMNKRPQSDSVNTMALLAGIFGILSIVLFWLTIVLGIVFAIAAIVLGFIGKKQISEGEGTGRGWAITGIALGFVTILLTAILAILIAALI